MLTLISARLYRPSQFTLPMPTSPRMLLMIPPSVASMNFHTVPTRTMEEITGMNRGALEEIADSSTKAGSQQIGYHQRQHGLNRNRHKRVDQVLRIASRKTDRRPYSYNCPGLSLTGGFSTLYSVKLKYPVMHSGSRENSTSRRKLGSTYKNPLFFWINSDIAFQTNDPLSKDAAEHFLRMFPRHPSTALRKYQ